MPMNHPHRLIAGTAVAVLASATALAGSAHAAPAIHKPAPVSPWTKLSTGAGVGTVTQPRVVRWGTKLLVVWNQQTPADFSIIKSRILGSNGKPLGPISNVVNWLSASNDPDPVLIGGVPTVVFGGQRTVNSLDPYYGELAYAQAGDATHWALGPGSLSQNTSAYGDYGFGVVDVGHGHPVTAGAYSSSNRVTVHDGFDAAAPAAHPDHDTTGTGDAEQVNVARDSKTGAAYALWYSGDTHLAYEGIHAAKIWPAIGPVSAPAPLSTISFEGARASVNPSQDVSVTSRIGGGVWAAYASGYPLPQKLVLWHVGTAHTVALHTSGDIQYTGISAAPGGRLWVWWVQNQTLYAARTNPSVTKFGVIRAVRSPATPGQSPTRTGGDGSRGPLDAVINVIGKDKDGSGNPEAEIFSTRILEGLKVTVAPGKISYVHGGRLTVKVSDAGVAVAGAAVRVGNVIKHTNAHGLVTFAIAKKSGKGAHLVSAGLAGWYPGRASFRVG